MFSPEPKKQFVDFLVLKVIGSLVWVFDLCHIVFVVSFFFNLV